MAIYAVGIVCVSQIHNFFLYFDLVIINLWLQFWRGKNRSVLLVCLTPTPTPTLIPIVLRIPKA